MYGIVPARGIRHIGAGEVVLVEDTTGKGHITRSSGDKPRHTIFVPVDRWGRGRAGTAVAGGNSIDMVVIWWPAGRCRLHVSQQRRIVRPVGA